MYSLIKFQERGPPQINGPPPGRGYAGGGGRAPSPPHRGYPAHGRPSSPPILGHGHGSAGLPISRGPPMDHLSAGPPVILPPPPPPVPQLPPPFSRHVKPLMSFKSFMKEQEDDLSIEEFQRRYEDYHRDYVVRFSDTFFEVSKFEEWFRERYDPVKIQDQETEAEKWAADESAVIRNALAENPFKVIRAMRLDPIKPGAGDDHNRKGDREGATTVGGSPAGVEGIVESADSPRAEGDRNDSNDAVTTSTTGKFFRNDLWWVGVVYF